MKTSESARQYEVKRNAASSASTHVVPRAPSAMLAARVPVTRGAAPVAAPGPAGCASVTPPCARGLSLRAVSASAPAGEEQVGLAAHLAASVRREHQPVAVGAEDREPVEAGIARDGLGSSTPHAHAVEVEVAAGRILAIRGV